MDVSVSRALNDKLYEKRKQGALDLEKSVRDAIAVQDRDKISKIVDQLCQEFAYAVHAPHARNGGLIGLAAVSIGLGSVSMLENFHIMDAEILRWCRMKSHNSCKLSSLRYLPASSIKMQESDTMPARLCTISQKLPKARYWSISTMSSTPSARHACPFP